jgi:heme-degrading monooxygenase HmoA
MFIARSTCTIANDMSEEVRAALKARTHLVDGKPGFAGMEFMRPLKNANEIWLVGRWTDEASSEIQLFETFAN